MLHGLPKALCLFLVGAGHRSNLYLYKSASCLAEDSSSLLKILGSFLVRIVLSWESLSSILKRRTCCKLVVSDAVFTTTALVSTGLHVPWRRTLRQALLPFQEDTTCHAFPKSHTTLLKALSFPKGASVNQSQCCAQPRASGLKAKLGHFSPMTRLKMWFSAIIGLRRSS